MAIVSERPLVVQADRGGVVDKDRSSAAMAVLVAMLLAGGVLLLYAGRHLTFFYDDWEFILNRRWATTSTWLVPHNGHPTMFPVAVYKVLFAIVGLRHYTPYRAVEVLLHLLCVALLYELCARRLGPWLALVPAVLLLLMGSAWQDLLWPASMGFLTSVAGGLGALLLLERRDIRRDAGATVLLIWSLTGSGTGLAFLAAAAAMLFMQRASWRRWWVVALPAALFLLWYVTWGSNQPVTSDAILGAPQYIADATSGAVAGIAGFSLGYGPALLVALLMVIAVSWRRRHLGQPTPMLIAAGVGALTFWGLAAIARASFAEPAASRYLYVGAVFILLIAAEARVGTGLRGGWLAVGGVLLAGTLIANMNALRAGERGLRASDDSVRASLAVVQVAAPVVAPNFVAEPINAPGVNAWRYLLAVRSLGSPALTLPELERAPESIRQNSDSVLERAEALTLTAVRGPITGTRSVSVDRVAGGRIVPTGACLRFEANTGGGTLDLILPADSQLLLHAQPGRSVELYLRRFASIFSAPFGAVNGGGGSVMRFPADGAAQLPWHMRVAASQRVDVCAR